MGSQVLKLLLTTRNFWLLSPSSSSELLLPSRATAITGTGMEDTGEDTEAMAAMAMATMGTTARGPLMLSLRLRLMLSPPPLLSPAMVTTDTAMDMEDTEATTTARDLPMLSPAMVTMVMVMEDTEEVITVTPWIWLWVLRLKKSRSSC